MTGNWKTGKLETGELENWKTGRLEDWKVIDRNCSSPSTT
jgi:hypothetical protein